MSPLYQNRRKPPTNVFGAQISAVLNASTDTVEVVSEILGDGCQRWREAIRRTRLREVTTRAKFDPGYVHRANTWHERRFFALMLIVLQEVALRPGRKATAFTKQLWRGRTYRWRVTDDGEWRRCYVPSSSSGGLAARLGCSVREIDRYLTVAKSADVLGVRQIRGRASIDRLPRHLKGREWPYALFTWLGDLPQAALAVLRRARGEPARESAPPSSHSGAAAPPAGESAQRFLAMVSDLLPHPETS